MILDQEINIVQIKNMKIFLIIKFWYAVGISLKLVVVSKKEIHLKIKNVILMLMMFIKKS